MLPESFSRDFNLKLVVNCRFSTLKNVRYVLQSRTKWGKSYVRRFNLREIKLVMELRVAQTVFRSVRLLCSILQYVHIAIVVDFVIYADSAIKWTRRIEN